VKGFFFGEGEGLGEGGTTQTEVVTCPYNEIRFVAVVSQGGARGQYGGITRGKNETGTTLTSKIALNAFMGDEYDDKGGVRGLQKNCERGY